MRRTAVGAVVVLACVLLAAPAGAKPKPNAACRAVSTLTATNVSLEDPTSAKTYDRATGLFQKMSVKRARKIGNQMAHAKSIQAKWAAVYLADNFCKY